MVRWDDYYKPVFPSLSQRDEIIKRLHTLTNVENTVLRKTHEIARINSISLAQSLNEIVNSRHWQQNYKSTQFLEEEITELLKSSTLDQNDIFSAIQSIAKTLESAQNYIKDYYSLRSNVLNGFSLIPFNLFIYSDDQKDKEIAKDSDLDDDENANNESLDLDNSNELIYQPFQQDLIITDKNIIRDIKRNPDIIYQIDSFKFEEIVAELLKAQGYEVQVTQQTRDGGKDIRAIHKTLLGEFLYYVECKKNRKDKNVGVGFVRELYGVVLSDKATAGILVTTSFFTEPAQKFQKQNCYQIQLKDYYVLKDWIDKYNGNY